jgi:putative oxidoreductase
MMVPESALRVPWLEPWRLGTVLDLVPLSLVLFLTRIGVGHDFWASLQVKLASWPTTLQLFAIEYRLPLLPPGFAAYAATTVEVSGALMLFLGLLARLAAVQLLGLVAVIQLCVYPQNWPDHLLWIGALLLIAARGAGAISLDHLLLHIVRGS